MTPQATKGRNDYHRRYQADQRAASREITIRKCADRRRRNRLLKNPPEFLKWYFPDRYTRPFCDDQLEAIQHIIDCARMGVDEIICAERGGWKTETTKGMIVYLILAQIIKFPVIVGATGRDACAKYDDIKAKFCSELLAADFPEVCDPIIALDYSPQKAQKQTFNGLRTDFVWTAFDCTFPTVAKVPGTNKPSPYSKCAMTWRGLDGAIRGINLFGRRPDLAFCDDLETRESAEQDGQIEKRETLLDKDVGGLAGGGASLCRIVLGTIQNDKCLTKRKLDQWGGKRYPGVKRWPEGTQDQERLAKELRDEYVQMYCAEKAEGAKLMPKAHAFYLENQKAIELNVEMSAPENYSRKLRPDGTTMEVSGFHRICNLIARNTTAETDGMDYVLTEIQNNPRKSKGHQTAGLTYSKVMTRISGFKQGEVAKDNELITAAIDLGQYACHWVIMGWKTGLIGNVINYGVAEVNAAGKEQEQIDIAIRRTLLQWRTELAEGSLCPEMPDNVLIDSGNHRDPVYGFVKEVDDGTGTFKAAKGVGTWRNHKPIDGRLIVGTHWEASLQPVHAVWLYNLDTSGLKKMVHQMWLTPTFDEARQFNPMSLSLYAAFDDNGKPWPRRHQSIAKHQVAEEFREQFVPGKGMKRWWHQLNPNNHYFDAVYMNVAAAIMKGVWMPTQPAPSDSSPSPQKSRPPRPVIKTPHGQPYLVTERL